ncbi:MAG: hypothetical protein AB1425_02285 [Actinomycetota bacterium]
MTAELVTPTDVNLIRDYCPDLIYRCKICDTNRHNDARMKTGFTVYVDARQRAKTGISWPPIELGLFWWS